MLHPHILDFLSRFTLIANYSNFVLTAHLTSFIETANESIIPKTSLIDWTDA